VRLPVPRAGEEVSVRLPSRRVVSCAVRSYDGVLVLSCGRVPGVSVGDRVVLRRVRDGQVYLFPEEVVGVSPLALTCTCPVVVREPRVPAVVSVLYGPPGGPCEKTRVVDVSPGGMCFHAWLPPPREGSELDLEFDLYPLGIVRARGAVARVYGWIPQWPEVGVRFLEVSPKGRQAIFAWMRCAGGVPV
ncbi:MAG: PilZ domain-containing protein, partial [Bacillota bacterium]